MIFHAYCLLKSIKHKSKGHKVKKRETLSDFYDLLPIGQFVYKCEDCNEVWATDGTKSLKEVQNCCKTRKRK